MNILGPSASACGLVTGGGFAFRLDGAGFLQVLFLCVKGAGEGRWGWWFPAIVVVTLGPPGSLIGDLRIRRGLDR